MFAVEGQRKVPKPRAVFSVSLWQLGQLASLVFLFGWQIPMLAATRQRTELLAIISRGEFLAAFSKFTFFSRQGHLWLWVRTLGGISHWICLQFARAEMQELRFLCNG